MEKTWREQFHRLDEVMADGGSLNDPMPDDLIGKRP